MTMANETDMETLSQATQRLAAAGYTDDFRAAGVKLVDPFAER